MNGETLSGEAPGGGASRSETNSGAVLRDALIVRGLSKRYNLRPVITSVEFELSTGDVLGITGRNGSGKSTLLKLLANVLERSEGSIKWIGDGRDLKEEELPIHLGFVAPYLQLYTEFTAWEHLRLLADMRGVPLDADRGRTLFGAFGLSGRLDDPLRSYSSGMLQRAKYVYALVHNPRFLFLDEPMTNLDESGMATVREIVQRERNERITVIATNDRDDLEMCGKEIGVEG